jgi:hypothetical protein
MSCMDRILADSEIVHEEMRWWIQLHVARTLIADIPACLFFLNAMLREVMHGKSWSCLGTQKVKQLLETPRDMLESTPLLNTGQHGHRESYVPDCGGNCQSSPSWISRGGFVWIRSNFGRFLFENSFISGLRLSLKQYIYRDLINFPNITSANETSRENRGPSLKFLWYFVRYRNRSWGESCGGPKGLNVYYVGS